MQQTLGVFLLSYRRPEYVLQALDSVLKQDCENLTVLISENSPDEDVYRLIQSHLKLAANPHQHQIRVIRRTPSLGSLAHFNQILTEAKQFSFVMLFHDDDVLLPGALKKMKNHLEESPELAAVSCNAYILNQDKRTEKLFNPNLKTDLKLTRSRDLILHYLRPELSHTPFPAYIYRSSHLQHKLNTQDGGKHSDVSFLVHTIEQGPFLWLAEPLLYYRRHSLNDSKTISLTDTMKISLFYFKKCPGLALWILVFVLKSVLKFIFDLTRASVTAVGKSRSG